MRERDDSHFEDTVEWLASPATLSTNTKNERAASPGRCRRPAGLRKTMMIDHLTIVMARSSQEIQMKRIELGLSALKGGRSDTAES
jgi:hypothetical protein